MAEYIEREAVMEALMDEQYGYLCEKAIQAIPNADVAPVRHGKWIIKDKHINQCNRCGNYLDIRGLNGGRGDANYCPNCGARMDGE